MTEPDDQHPDDARAERAFRDALSQRADRLEPATLGTPGQRARRGRQWPLLVAGAAAIAVLAVTATLAVINAADDTGGPDLSAATADTDTTDTQTPTDEAPSGLRTVGYRDLEIEVPQEWASVATPNPNGCGYPETPFVATYDPTQAFRQNLCVNRENPPEGFPAAPQAEWTPNVQLSPTSAAAESLPDGKTTYDDWTLTRTTVGGVRIEILTDASTAAVVEPILASARTVETDTNGCDVTSPAQSNEFVRPEAFDLADIATVTSIAVCQYIRGDPTTPGLTGSTMLTGDDAQAELEAIQAAPAGGGPDNPQNCAPDLYGDSALVLRLGDQDATASDLYVYYDWCFGNGFDDGTTRRAITADNCPALFSGAVQQYSGDGSTFALCHPQGS